MPTFAQRLRNAFTALTGGEQIIAAATRPGDAHAGLRYRQVEAHELVLRYRKWVKVAVSRNASAVAMCRLMVMRKKPDRSLMGVRPISKVESKRLKDWAGLHAAKSGFSTTDELEEVTDDRHPLVQLIKGINPQSNTFEYIFNTAAALDLTGNSYTTMVKSRAGWSLPTELWHLPPQWTRPVPNEDGIATAYVYGRPGQEITLAPNTIIHFKNPDPFGNPWTGFGDLASCVDEADLSYKLTEFANRTLDNGAFPGGVVRMKPGATTDSINRTREEFEGKYASPRNAGRWMVVSNLEGIDWAPPLDKNPVLVSSDEWARSVIAACFDMPVGMLNMEEKSLANGKVVAPHWQLMAIKPRCQRIEDRLNEQLLPAFREVLNDPTLFVCFENPVAEEQDRLVVEVSTLKQAGIITVNEARNRMGLEPMEGGDTLQQPMDPFGAAFGSDSTPQPNTEATSSEATSDVDVKHVHGHASQMKAIWNTKPIETKERMDVEEDMRDIERALSNIFRTMIPVYADAVTGMGIHLPSNARMGFVSAIHEMLREPVANVVSRGYMLGSTEIGEPAMFQPSKAIDFLDSYRLQLADASVQAMEWRIRGILQTGLREGATTTQIATAIRTTLPDMSVNAAAVIARTETARAYNAGKELAWSESKTVVGKEWLLSGNPCKICRAVHETNRFAKIGEPFVKKGTVLAGTVLDYADINGGDAHPNCSCGIGAIRKDLDQ